MMLSKVCNAFKEHCTRHNKLNEMDIGMARSKNVHTAKRLALELGMNYAFGLEFVELTRGTAQEQNATEGERDSLGLHGNAILSKCFIDEPMIIRDELPAGYFAKKPVRGINANGFEIRLGGRMGLFSRLYQHDPRIRPQQQYFSVGNVHKLAETRENQAKLWDYFSFGQLPASIYGGRAIDPANQLGTLIQGDFGPKLCAMAGLVKLNGMHQRTFPCKCSPTISFGVISGDYFCSSMPASRAVHVTAPCYSPDEASMALTLSDHAIVSVVVQGDTSAQKRVFRSPQEVLDCYCPHSCDAAALDKRNRNFSCRDRVNYFIGAHQVNESDACAHVVNEANSPCGPECDPTQCKELARN